MLLTLIGAFVLLSVRNLEMNQTIGVQGSIPHLLYETAQFVENIGVYNPQAKLRSDFLDPL